MPLSPYQGENAHQAPFVPECNLTTEAKQSLGMARLTEQEIMHGLFWLCFSSSSSFFPAHISAMLPDDVMGCGRKCATRHVTFLAMARQDLSFVHLAYLGCIFLAIGTWIPYDIFCLLFSFPFYLGSITLSVVLSS